MGIFEGCLLAADADETLISNGIIPQRNKEKIKFFELGGGTFMLATGRLPCGMDRVKAQLDDLGLSLCCNGGLAYNFKTGEALFESTMAKEDYASFLEAKKLFPETPILCEYRELAYIPNPNDYALEHIAYEGLKWKPITEQQLLKQKLNKTVYLCQSVELCDKIKEAISPLAPFSEFTMSSLTIDTEKRYVLEQMPKGVSKATGVLELAKVLNINEGSIFAIGDYFNDLDMLKAADISAATYGAPDELKQVATVTVGTASNGAVADFIDYLYEKRKNYGNF